MRIVHFSTTPLAGAPIRLVRALARHTELDVRLVDLGESPQYDQDVRFDQTPELASELAESADVIHLHNYLDLNSQQFSPIDFGALRRKGVLVLRQFHSHPASVAKWSGLSRESLTDGSIPSLVVAQFQERFYPDARVVPNLLPVDDPAYCPGEQCNPMELMICTSTAYVPVGAWAVRWNTKGTPETLEIARRVQRRTGCSLRCPDGLSLAEIMALKQRTGVVIDEMVTGSYHLSGMEGLCVGRPVTSYLDARCRRVLAELSGSSECPFLNTNLGDAERVLSDLLADSDWADAIGAAGRRWIETYWSPQRQTQAYVDVYKQMLDDPTKVVRQHELRVDSVGSRWRAVVRPNLTHALRRAVHRVRRPFTPEGVADAVAKARSFRRRIANRLAPSTANEPAGAMDRKGGANR